MSSTIAGIELGKPGSYVDDIDTANEIEIVSRLHKLSEEECQRGMQGLVDYLHSLPSGLVVGRYITLLRLAAGCELDPAS